MAQFFAQFDALPEQTDAVLLRFHQVDKSQCDLAIPKDCKDARRNPQHLIDFHAMKVSNLFFLLLFG